MAYSEGAELVGGLYYDRVKRHYEYDDFATVHVGTAFTNYVVGTAARASAFFGAASALTWPRGADGKIFRFITSQNAWMQFGGANQLLRVSHHLRANTWYVMEKRCATIRVARATTTGFMELHVEG